MVATNGIRFGRNIREKPVLLTFCATHPSGLMQFLLLLTNWCNPYDTAEQRLQILTQIKPGGGFTWQ